MKLNNNKILPISYKNWKLTVIAFRRFKSYNYNMKTLFRLNFYKEVLL